MFNLFKFVLLLYYTQICVFQEIKNKISCTLLWYYKLWVCGSHFWILNYPQNTFNFVSLAGLKGNLSTFHFLHRQSYKSHQSCILTVQCKSLGPNLIYILLEKMGNTCSYLLIHMQTYMEMHVYKAKKKEFFKSFSL